MALKVAQIFSIRHFKRNNEILEFEIIFKNFPRDIKRHPLQTSLNCFRCVLIFLRCLEENIPLIDAIFYK